MNKIKTALLASSILAGATVLGATAYAKDADPRFHGLDISISGTIQYQAVFFDQDTDAHLRGYEFEAKNSNTELHFNVKGIADSGLQYGARIDWRPAARGGKGALDEAYLFFKGSWGEVRFGDDDGAQINRVSLGDNLAGTGGFDGDALHNIYVGAPTSYIGEDKKTHYDGDAEGRPGKISYEHYTDKNGKKGVKQVLDGVVALDGYWSSSPEIYDSSDATKIVYYTPNWSGFQAGLSYAPGADNENGDNTDIEGDLENMISASLHYDNTFNNGVTFGASAGLVWAGWEGDASNGNGNGKVHPYSKGDDKDSVLASSKGKYLDYTIKSPIGDKDYFGWQTALKVGYAGFTMIGAYGDDNIYGRYYGVTGSYEFGPNDLSLGWLHRTRSAKSDALSGMAPGQKDKLDVISAAYTRKLAEGLSVFGEYNYIKYNSNVLADNKGDTWIVGTRLQF